MARIVLQPNKWMRLGVFERHAPQKQDETMNILWALAFVFIVLWMLGFLAFHVTTGFIHVLLVLAVVAVVFRVVSGRRIA
jgi:hypothetical protein